MRAYVEDIPDFDIREKLYEVSLFKQVAPKCFEEFP